MGGLGPRYYASVGYRRIRHYCERRYGGYTHRGPLPQAAETILSEDAGRVFRAGSHFAGVWPRDLCFSAPGLCLGGHGEDLRDVSEWLLDILGETFHTDFRAGRAFPTPAEGVDTFPALVILFDEVWGSNTGVATSEGLDANAAELARLAALHRERFYDEDRHIVTGNGSAWWDSTSTPREAYNTAMLLTAVRRLERRGIETPYTGLSDSIEAGLLDELWTGTHVAEFRGSDLLACDANVVPLYFGLLDDDRAERVVRTLERLVTPGGLRLRERPFSLGQTRPEFLLHRDYHYHVWPWNSFAYANGLTRYGFDAAADREVDRIERRLARYGNFLEVLDVDGGPYVKRGYASAEDFTAAAALWIEYQDRRLG